MCLCVLFMYYCEMLYDGVVVCVAIVCAIVYKVLGCCVCELLCGDVCWLIAVFFVFVCLINVIGCCVNDVLNDVV